MEAVLILIGGFTGLVALIALSSIWRGFVLTKLWLWFVVPQFHLLPLSIPVAIGLSLIAGMFSTTCKKDDEKFGAVVAKAIAIPALGLLFAWVVTLFMA